MQDLTAAFHAQGGQELEVSSAEAFLSFLHLYSYERVEEMSVEEINELVKKAWEEFVLLQYNDEEKVELKMTPTEDKPSLFEKWLPLGGSKEPSHLKVGFNPDAKTPHSSAWTYSHELGRRHLEQTFPNEVTTVSYEKYNRKKYSISPGGSYSCGLQYYIYDNSDICAGKFKSGNYTSGSKNLKLFFEYDAPLHPDLLYSYA